MSKPSPVLSQQNQRVSQTPPMNQSSSIEQLQASTSLQPGFPSNHIGGAISQLGQHALPLPQNIQHHTNSSYDAAVDARQGLNSPGAGYDSGPKALTPNPPYIANDSSFVGPGQIHCLAAAGIECYCVRCTAWTKDFIIPLACNSKPSTSNLIPVQSYQAPSRLDTGTYTCDTGGSSYSFGQALPDLTYSYTGNSGSYPAGSSYGSVPGFVRGSAAPLDPSSTWSGPSFSSVDFLSGSSGYPSKYDDMRVPRIIGSQGIAGPNSVKRQCYPPTKERGQRRPGPPRQNHLATANAEIIASLDSDTFLEAQEILDTKLKNGKPLSDIQKDHLANLLEISAGQLEFCLVTKQVLEPMLREVFSTAQTYGLPTDYVVRWFGQYQQSHTLEKAPVQDSAYQSLSPNPRQTLEPPKKRQRTTRDANQHRVFQCTYIDSNGRHCLQESANLTDWKRHEETHWPQRRWECLIVGRSPNITCHICGGHIDLNVEQSQHGHAPCFGRMPRKGHDFPRKDKLVSHLRIEHNYESVLDSCWYPTQSDWKRQCGFCGSSFSNWDLRCEHVGKHFIEGKRMVPDWRDPWPVNETSDPDEDNGDDNDEDGDGDTRNDSHSDKDADGEDDLDHSPTFGGRQNSSRGDGSQSHTPGNKINHQDYNGNRTHRTDNDSNEGNNRGRQARNWSREPTFPASHQNLPILAPPRIRGPGGDDNVFKSIGQLGYGTFGSVDEVEHAATKMHFARKTLRVVHHRSFPALEQAQREVAALRSLKHTHIVDLAASYTFEDQFSIIMSPVAEWNLSEYMCNDVSPASTQISNLSRWLGCLTSAVAYMHEKSWQHLDIKPSNILITGGQVMLSDFGGSVILNGSGSSLLGNGCAITPMYCAPEVADRRGTSFVVGASDVYSLGCVFLEMATVIHRQSLADFERFRAFGSIDATYQRNPQKSVLWIDYLWDIGGGLGLPLGEGLHVIRNMLSQDWIKRPTARGIEDSLQLWHLQSEREAESKNFLIIAQAEASFDPLEVIRRWLQNCLDSHGTCTSPAEEFFPYRILNVGKSDGTIIRLQESGSSGPYVALSYAWGTTTTLKATSQTLNNMFESIPESSLSNTFLNAVRITRALGFHYLWIDALCIVQDSRTDWTRQVSQMSKIYSHSTLTICVANDTQVPATIKHEILDTRPHRTGSESPCVTCDNDYRVFKPLVDSTATTMLLDSPWSKRGWTLQERILSPRILYYSSNRFAWECDGERSTLDRVGRIRDSLKLLGIGKHPLPEKQNADTSFPLMRSFRKTWRDIVREYSRRHLSFATDKLPALAGVAYEMAAMSRQPYAAGLWKGDLINDLLWCRDFPTIPLPRPPYRAPSWSWASIDSPVVWSKSVNYPVEKHAQILDCQTKVLSELAPFAGVSDGYLQVRGLSRKVLVTYSRPEEVLDRQSLRPLAFAQWDALDVQKTASTDARLKGDPVEELLCLQILCEAGLLLREITEGDSQRFQRVGVYWNQTVDGSEPVFDEAWKICSITVV